MHYYQFNIGDYTSHTAHLDPIEDIAYRRMMDVYYLNECALPESSEEVSRLVRMRTHCDVIAAVLQEFFTLTDGEWRHSRMDAEIEKYRDKSDKAKKSAEARWRNKANSCDANALQPQSEGNANHKPITNNHKPVNKARPTDANEVTEYARSIGFILDGQKFIDHYDANGWVRGKTKIKDWKACVRTWKGNQRGSENGAHQQDNRSRAKRVSDTLDAIAARDMQENGHSETLD